MFSGATSEVELPRWCLRRETRLISYTFLFWREFSSSAAAFTHLQNFRISKRNPESFLFYRNSHRSAQSNTQRKPRSVSPTTERGKRIRTDSPAAVKARDFEFDPRIEREKVISFGRERDWGELGFLLGF